MAQDKTYNKEEVANIIDKVTRAIIKKLRDISAMKEDSAKDSALRSIISPEADKEGHRTSALESYHTHASFDRAISNIVDERYFARVKDFESK